MINYITIKRVAKEAKCKVKDLMALAPKNDPFYVGTPGDLEKADWFAGLWEEFGYSSGVHLRRIHYQAISQDPPLRKPNGEIYGNTLQAWSYLNQASKLARYLNVVDPAAFVDRRNPDPILHASYYGSSDPDVWISGSWHGFEIEEPEFPPLPSFRVGGYDDTNLQPYHLEIWVEKSTMNDVLEPLCQRYGINLVTGAGELSITAVVALLKRATDANRPVRIAYIADFDPAGHGMPVSVARKIEFFTRQKCDDNSDVRLEPLVLTAEQVQEHNLPRTPIKETELRRGVFEAIHGGGAVELDALEALHPGELAHLVEAWILTYHDPEITSEAREVKYKLLASLDKTMEHETRHLLPRVAENEKRFAVAVEQFMEEISDIQDDMGEAVREWTIIMQNIVKVTNINDFPVPEGETAIESDTMFDSSVSYWDQLDRYKVYRAGG